MMLMLNTVTMVLHMITMVLLKIQIALLNYFKIVQTLNYFETRKR